MPRLAKILLCDLQLDRLVGFFQRGEQWRRRLANLEIDGTIFDLNDDVGVELTVERMKVVVSGARTVVFRIAPVHVMVVDESAIEQQSAVRLERTGNHIRSVGVGSAVS